MRYFYNCIEFHQKMCLIWFLALQSHQNHQTVKVTERDQEYTVEKLWSVSKDLLLFSQ